jgi:hypothetical protein
MREEVSERGAFLNMPAGVKQGFPLKTIVTSV